MQTQDTSMGAERGLGVSSAQGMGPLELAFFVVAAAGPLLVVAGFLPLAFLIGGIGAPGAQLVAGIVLLLFAVGFTKMSANVRNRGAFYAYISKGLGKPIGGGSAVLATVAYSAIAIGQFGAFGAFASGTLKRLGGIEIDWFWLALAALLLVSYLGYRQITLSAKVLGVALFAEVTILLILAVPVLLTGGAAGFDFQAFSFSNIFAGGSTGAMFAIVFGAFIGFESTAIYAEETRNPARNVPLATYISIGFLAIFYSFMAWIAVVAFGTSEVVAVATANPTEMFFMATERYVGHQATVVMEILVITSTFASSLAFHNTASRYIFTLGREGLFPAIFGKVDAANGSPVVAGFTLSALGLVAVLVFRWFGADPYLHLFLFLVAPGILAVIVLQMLCSLAVLRYFRANPDAGGSVATRVLAPLAGFVGLLVASWLVTSNFGLLTGQAGAVNAILLAIPCAAFLLGVARTLILQRTDPQAYGQLAEAKIM